MVPLNQVCRVAAPSLVTVGFSVVLRWFPTSLTASGPSFTVASMRKVAALLLVVAALLPAAAAAAGSSPDPIGGVDLATGPSAIPFAELDGFEADTAPLRVSLPPGSGTPVLLDTYGKSIPFTGRHPDGVVGLPGLLGGYYELRTDKASVKFHITGTGEVPVDPGPVLETSSLLTIVSATLLVLGTALVLKRRLRPLGILLLLFAGGSWAYPKLLSDDGAPIASCASVHPDPSTELLDCAVERGAVLVDQGDFPAAIRELEDANIGACHEVAHLVGVRSWLRSSAPVKDVLRPGFDVCNHAFYHGALYGGATYMDDESFAAAVIDSCDVIYPDDRPGGGACAHGVGHSLMLRFGHDLERVDAICRSMRTTRPIRILECRGAALMEYSVIYRRASGDPARAPQLGRHPTELCQEASEELQVFCYGGLAMATPRSDTSARELLEFCAALAGGRSLRCVEGVVPEFRSHLGRPNLDGSVCRVLNDAGREICARQYAYFIFDQYADTALSIRICDEAGVPVEVCLASEKSARDWSRTDLPEG